MMENTLGDKVFSFVVISDTHVNPDEDDCNSPFPVNKRANRRFRYVVQDINKRSVDFAVHLGDLLHPVPDSGQPYHQAAEKYRDIVADLEVPIHVLPGNHDIGDTPIKGGPASPTTQAMINIWRDEFGPDYQAFSRDGVRFILLNAQLINSGLDAESAQKAWFEKQLLSVADERVFLLLHHPAYLTFPNEQNHYDNTNEPGRSWLLGLLKKYEIEAMFSGHAHNFWYNRYFQTDYYLAPSTSFVRQDYSEMLRTPPPENSELGRNDAAKLGYFVVTVYTHGHTTKFVRTYGAELGPSYKLEDDAIPLAADPREGKPSFLGFDLRQNWAEITEIPPSGGLDEFDRKLVRNDYHLLALQEMGIRNIRVPLTDLLDSEKCVRLIVLKHLGFDITLFGFDIPDVKTLAQIERHANIFKDWEITFDWSDMDQRWGRLHGISQSIKLPIYVSRMRTKDDIKSEGMYFHVINHGFSASDLKQLKILKEHGISGAVFRLGHSDDVAQTIDAIHTKVKTVGIKASVHLRLADDNPALVKYDEMWACQRASAAIQAAQGRDNLRVFCDTLVDVDRGYFARLGAIDRNCNPRKLLDVIKKKHFDL